MVKIEYDRFRKLEELEFKLLKELDIGLKEPIKEEIETKFNLFFRSYSYTNYLKIIEVLKLIDSNKVICSNNMDFYVFENTLNLNVGEIICLDTENSEIFNIEEGVLDDKFLEDCGTKLKFNGRMNEQNWIDNTIIKREHIEKMIKKVLEEEKTGKKEELERERVKEDKEFKKELKKQNYNQTSIFENNEIKINKNRIMIGGVKFVLTKNVNAILKYDFVDTYYISSNKLKKELITKEEGFTFYQTNKKIYELKYETNKKERIIKSLEEKDYYSKVKINGVIVRRNKIHSILDRIDEKTTKEEIKLWNKFTQTQLDLINLKEFSVEYTPLKIDISYYSKDLFLVNLFGKKEKIDWNTLYNVFFIQGRTIYHNLSISKFMNLSQKLKFTKQEVYDKLKQLSEKNEN